MKKTSTRISAGSFDDASARLWAKFPRAVAIVIKYLYCGWYEYSVLN